VLERKHEEDVKKQECLFRSWLPDQTPCSTFASASVWLVRGTGWIGSCDDVRTRGALGKRAVLCWPYDAIDHRPMVGLVTSCKSYGKQYKLSCCCTLDPLEIQGTHVGTGICGRGARWACRAELA
jgi:hypothetical protein